MYLLGVHANDDLDLNFTETRQIMSLEMMEMRPPAISSTASVNRSLDGIYILIILAHAVPRGMNELVLI